MRHYTKITIGILSLIISSFLFHGCLCSNGSISGKSSSKEDSATDKSSNSISIVSDFGANPGNLLMYTYIPEDSGKNSPLLIALHGCGQNVLDYSSITDWNKLADANKFLIVYPEQQPANNDSLCFNWGKSDSEIASIWSMVETMIQNHSIDSNQIYITGFCAGGFMAATIMAQYRDLIAGGIIIGGGPYKCAQSTSDVETCKFPGIDRDPNEWKNIMASGCPSCSSAPKLYIIHGGIDFIISPMNIGELYEQWNTVGSTVEIKVIDDMGHKIPVNPGTSADQGGLISPYSVNSGWFSSYEAGLWMGFITIGIDHTNYPVNTNGDYYTGSSSSSYMIDEEKPTTNILSPLPDSTVNGVVPIVAVAADSNGVAYVEVYIDDVLYATLDAEPYTYDWNTLETANATHTVKIIAYDTNGDFTIKTIDITTDNGSDDQKPMIAISSPANGSTIQETITISATASDDRGISRVDFYIGTTLVYTDTTSPYTFSWDSATVANGNQSIIAIAYDNSSNASETAISVNVDNSITGGVSGNGGADGYIKAYTDGTYKEVGSLAMNALAIGRGGDEKHNRAILTFDTSFIPDDVSILRAYLVISHAENCLTASCHAGDPWANSNNLITDIKHGYFGSGENDYLIQATDWDEPANAENIALFASFSNGTQQSTDFTAAGLAAINKTGITQVRLRFQDFHSTTAYLFIMKSTYARLYVYYDIEDPTVAITSPGNGASVSGTTTINATASDDTEITKVEFYVDDVLRSTDTEAPYSYNWNTIGQSGLHSIKAVAYDAANKTATHTISVIVNNSIQTTTISFDNIASEDGYVKANSNGTYPEVGMLYTYLMAIGRGGDAKDNRAILSFNLSTLPGDAIITRAYLTVTHASSCPLAQCHFGDPWANGNMMVIDIKNGFFNDNSLVEAADWGASADATSSSGNIIASFPSFSSGTQQSSDINPAGLTVISNVAVGSDRLQVRLRFLNFLTEQAYLFINDGYFAKLYIEYYQ